MMQKHVVRFGSPETLKPELRAVYDVVCALAEVTGHCVISKRTLGEIVGCHPETAKSRLEAVRSFGLVECGPVLDATGASAGFIVTPCYPAERETR